MTTELDKKISSLPEVSTSDNTDVLTVLRPTDPVGTKNKKITKQNFLKELWTNFANYFTKTESDNRYLQSFTEEDPVFNEWLDTDPLADFLTEETDPDSIHLNGDNSPTADIDFDSNGIDNLSHTHFDNDYEPTGTEPVGSSYWDKANKTFSDVLENGVIGQRYEEDFIAGQNDTGVTIVNGKVATYASSIGNSGNIRIHLTVASKDEHPMLTVGVVTASILNGGVGKITTRGKVRGIQTNGANYGETWVDKDILYKSCTIAGGLTNIPPEAPCPAIPIAVVISAHATNGTLLVRPTLPTSMQMLSDVNGTDPVDGSLPTFHEDRDVFDFDKNINNYKPYSGFLNRTDSTISIDGSGVFTLAPTVTSFDVYTNGTGKHTLITPQTVSVIADQTITYIYIDSAGVLQKSTTPWDLSSGNNAPCAIVFKDGSTYTITDERHGYERNKSWHKWAHFNIGAMYFSGLTGVFTNTTLSVTQGVIYDEDISFDTGATKTSCSLWYRNATNGMRIIRNSTTPYRAVAGALKYDNGTGTLANVDNNKYTTQWVYATNDPTEPIYVVIGQNNDTLVATARNATKPIINLSTAEWKLIYRVIYRNQGGTPTYIESADFRSVQTGVPSSVGLPTDHASLTGRELANSHPATAISYDNTISGLTATEVQSAIDEVQDNINNIDLSGYVPYIGATADLDMGSQSIIVQYLLDQADPNLNSIGVNDRILYANDGTTGVLKWGDTGGYINGGNDLYAINLNEAYLYSGAQVALDWNVRALYDSTGTFVATWRDQARFWGGFDGGSGYYYWIDMNNSSLGDPAGTHLNWSLKYLDNGWTTNDFLLINERSPYDNSVSFEVNGKGGFQNGGYLAYFADSLTPYAGYFTNSNGMTVKIIDGNYSALSWDVPNFWGGALAGSGGSFCGYDSQSHYVWIADGTRAITTTGEIKATGQYNELGQLASNGYGVVGNKGAGVAGAFFDNSSTETYVTIADGTHVFDAYGQAMISLSNDNYTNDSGAGSVLYLKNPNSTGQNVVYSEIGGNMVAKWRTDYVGNISWVAGTYGSHDFYVGGDYGTGIRLMNLHNSGVITFAPTGFTDLGNGAMSIETSNNILMGISTDNTVDKLQVGGIVQAEGFKGTSMATSDPADGTSTLWYDISTRQVYVGS